jgi:hydrogenase large subunit
MSTIQVGPLTRIEGHMDIEADVDATKRVTSARSSGTSFRGFEIILIGRDPKDSTHLTQRICGVCPISHGVASSLALESAFGLPPTDNGRIMRNLVLGANYLQSHILHFYHLALVDYIDTSTALPMAPWKPRYMTGDLLGGADAARLATNYVSALAYRRKAHQLAAIFGGKLPHSPSLVATGCTAKPTAQDISDFRTLLLDIRGFVRDTYVPDVQLLAQRFPDYYRIGRGYGNLLAYGAFELDAQGSKKLFRRGRYTDGQYDVVDPRRISEYVKYSRLAASTTNLNPAVGVTTPDTNKAGAYSWCKAPRYLGKVHEVGPLARMWINGDYRRGISVMDRLMARALEAQKLAYAMEDWLNQLIPDVVGKTDYAVPDSGTGAGLTEAARGALGHWVQVANKLVTRYQVITPTAWNASPMDDMNQKGPIERALMGTTVVDDKQPVELLRVAHSFDPCLACAVHTMRAPRDVERIVAGETAG